jgi:hypothetical protein
LKAEMWARTSNSNERERRRRRRESEKIVRQAVDAEMAACTELFIWDGLSLPWLLLVAQCFPPLFYPLRLFAHVKRESPPARIWHIWGSHAVLMTSHVS